MKYFSLFLACLWMNFQSFAIYADKDDCESAISKMRPEDWAGMPEAKIRQQIENLKVSANLNQETYYVIVSDEGTTAGADTTQRLTFDFRCQSRRLNLERVQNSPDGKTTLYKITASPAFIGQVLDSLSVQKGSNKNGIRWVSKDAPWEVSSDGFVVIESTRRAEPAQVFTKVTEAFKAAEVGVETEGLAKRPLSRTEVMPLKESIREHLKGRLSNEDHPGLFKSFEGLKAVRDEIEKDYGGWSLAKMWAEKENGADILDLLEALNRAQLIKFITLRRPHPDKMAPETSLYVIELIVQVPALPPSKAMPKTIRLTLNFDWAA